MTPQHEMPAPDCSVAVGVPELARGDNRSGGCETELPIVKLCVPIESRDNLLL